MVAFFRKAVGKEVNWHNYNEELVVQGEFLLDFDWISKGWKSEVRK